MEKIKLRIPKRNKTVNDVSEYFEVTVLTVLNWKKKGCPYSVIAMPNELGNRTTSRFNFKEISLWHKNYLKNIEWGRPKIKKD